ncbi:hypothetical protein [Kitasatospora cheerisanensis]|uniref:DUF461 domain-containing protein n=1 Tax=Kitasatospora cheerisanensis KCTC 2395 TaxID=1348663 RepID=A0A066YT35_9ACTN|nr:hypothetical protein [Kitasatospora cheerisanensis]KDN84678.1 hypothetical protein KCH_35430 [Kitasatospora cheerisanensis KCTC 2395]
MSRSLRRGAAAALVLAAIVPLSACAAGNDADTLQIKPDNAATSIGNEVKLNNIVVVAPEGSAGEYSGPVAVTANIANTAPKDDLVLTSVKVGGTAATLTDENGAKVSEITIKAGQSVLLGGKEGAAGAQVSGAKLSVGGYADTTFTFKTAGEVSTPANVQPAAGLYQGFGPQAKAATSPTAGATSSPGASSPSPGAATGSPSAPASGSPSASAH